MKKLTHTEHFIKILERVIESVNPYHYGSELLFTSPGGTENKLWELTYCYYMLHYHLIGRIMVNESNAGDYEKYVEARHGNDRFKDAIMEALKADCPSYTMIGDEFWELCPEPSRIKEYIPVFKAHFKGVIERIPLADDLTFDKMLFGDNYYNKHINKYRSDGLISKEDAEYMLVKISQVVEALNSVVRNIIAMFAKFEAMAPGDMGKIDYEQLREDLEEYVSGVSKADLEIIIRYGKLPEGANKPVWKGSRNEAWKFMKWLKWKFPVFNAIFEMPGGKPLRSNDNNNQQGINEVDEKSGVCMILREYMPDHKL